jgi:hypothetical protein
MVLTFNVVVSPVNSSVAFETGGTLPPKPIAAAAVPEGP